MLLIVYVYKLCVGGVCGWSSNGSGLLFYIFVSDVFFVRTLNCELFELISFGKFYGFCTVLTRLNLPISLFIVPYF